MVAWFPSTLDKIPHATQYWTVSPTMERSPSVEYTATTNWTFDEHIQLLTWSLAVSSFWTLPLFRRRSEQLGHEVERFYGKKRVVDSANKEN